MGSEPVTRDIPMENLYPAWSDCPLVGFAEAGRQSAVAGSGKWKDNVFPVQGFRYLLSSLNPEKPSQILYHGPLAPGGVERARGLRCSLSGIGDPLRHPSGNPG